MLAGCPWPTHSVLYHCPICLSFSSFLLPIVFVLSIEYYSKVKIEVTVIIIEGNLIFKNCKVELGDKEEFGHLKIFH